MAPLELLLELESAPVLVVQLQVLESDQDLELPGPEPQLVLLQLLPVLVLDLQQVVVELEHLQEEPWVQLPPLEPWASLELSKLGFPSRTL